MAAQSVYLVIEVTIRIITESVFTSPLRHLHAFSSLELMTRVIYMLKCI